jgi:hypothetical protein
MFDSGRIACARPKRACIASSGLAFLSEDSNRSDDNLAVACSAVAGAVRADRTVLSQAGQWLPAGPSWLGRMALRRTLPSLRLYRHQSRPTRRACGGALQPAQYSGAVDQRGQARPNGRGCRAAPSPNLVRLQRQLAVLPPPRSCRGCRPAGGAPDRHGVPGPVGRADPDLRIQEGQADKMDRRR